MGLGADAVERVILRYPEVKARSKYLHDTCTTYSYNFNGGGRRSGRRDPTADAALRNLALHEREELWAINYAIKQTYHYDDGLDRMRAIHLIYWKNPRRSVEAAATAIESSAYYVNMYRQDFIRAVGYNLGLTACKGCVFWRKLIPGYKACHYCWDMGQLREKANGICLCKSDDLETLKKAFWFDVDRNLTAILKRRLADEQEKKSTSM